ncbi:hypothetical protein GALMADRAFT_59568 [Galerina marginata CBS 339.88]|uniref:Carbonic anhydrase n=1 Tax=Galerina marginata (strain CBS 339.88) TaxID=685588 RepID=A0A067TEU3_GALM3|nr:hypothetical protein GALMADRAFT_59568 [Galerina marginata CBS 339.88]
MAALDRILASNAQWAADVAKHESMFFKQSAQGQTPHTLWIGCADSRVPESVVTGSKPGDIFVHRNIANQFHVDDGNALAVLRYAVEHLNVEHVVVVGHTSCGGAGACLAAAQSPTFSSNGPIATIPTLPADADLNKWLDPLTRLAASLKLAPDQGDAVNILVEANVKKQVDNLAKTEIMRNAWAKGQKLSVHGWVYELGTGLLKDLNVSRA